jgi:hypothetical protein
MERVAKDRFATKTSLAVSSIEFCQSLLDEREIRIRLGSGRSHRAMIPLRQIISFSLFALNCRMSFDMKQLTITG